MSSHNYSSKTDNRDFEFFKKWQKIIEVEYTNYTIKENQLSLTLIDLKSYQKNFQNKREKDISIEINGLNVGFIDDYSFEESVIKIKIDDNQINLSKNGTLHLKFKTYQPVLQKQKKALKDFSFSKIVNQDLKQMLISPNLIRYRPIKQKINLNLKNKSLTLNQQNIIHKAFNEKNIFLIQGPPGTGKTTVIKELIYQTITHNSYSKILIVSQQNVAVDNVLHGIDEENRDWFEEEGHSIVRVAPNEDKIQYEKIKEYTVENWFKRYKNRVHHNFIELERNKNFSSKEKKVFNQKLYNYSNEWLKLISKFDFREIDNEVKELLILTFPTQKIKK